MTGDGGARAAAWAAAAAVLIGSLLAAAYGGSLSMALTGDDYEWAQWAHRALHEPRLLLAPHGFFRPTATLSLAADRLAWGTDPFGHRLTNLAAHGLAALLVVLVAARYGLPRGVALLVAAVWAVSPFASEAVLSVSVRHDSFLLVGWCLLLLAWPLGRQRWGAGRGAAVAAGLLLAMASKEVWVVTPVLVLTAALVGSGFRWRPALVHAGWSAALVAAYLAAYRMWAPRHPGYLVPDHGAALKLANALAAFLGLEPLRAAGFAVTWPGVLAVAAAAALALRVLRRREPAGVIGLALLVAAPLPTLLVPFQPARYVAAAYAGFLMVVAAAAVGVARGAGARAVRLAVVGLAAAWAVAVAVRGGAVRTGELADARAIAAAHGALLAEAEAVADGLRTGVPVALVRGERWLPVAEVIERPQGLDKAFYLRTSDPYGLVDGAALLDWALDRPGVVVVRVDDWRERFEGVPGRVLVHRRGGFQWAGGEVADLAAAARGWAESGLPVRVALPEPH